MTSVSVFWSDVRTALAAIQGYPIRVNNQTRQPPNKCDKQVLRAILHRHNKAALGAALGAAPES